MKSPHYDNESERKPQRKTVRESAAFKQWSAQLHDCFQVVELMPVACRSAAIEELEYARVLLGIALLALALREGRRPGMQRQISLINAYLI